MFGESIVALVTPLSEGNVDVRALEKLIEWHIEAGTDAILVCGSTGEGLLLSDDEKSSIIARSIEIANGRVPIIVGCSACSTQETARLVGVAEEEGASGVLVIAPFYVKPTQRGIIHHFTKIHDESNIPIILYNNPGRCAVDMTVDTIVELAGMTRIVALKDSNTNLARVSRLRTLVDPAFTLFSGDDLSLAGYLAHGGDGTISVTANVVPALLKRFMAAWKSGDIPTFQELNQLLIPIGEALFLEPNPIPVKYVLHKMGIIQNEIRLPLMPASEITMKTLDLFRNS
jgi:4-hydroxy-tetrahydrodipicolinate synthase